MGETLFISCQSSVQMSVIISQQRMALYVIAWWCHIVTYCMTFIELVRMCVDGEMERV